MLGLPKSMHEKYDSSKSAESQNLRNLRFRIRRHHFRASSGMDMASAHPKPYSPACTRFARFLVDFVRSRCLLTERWRPASLQGVEGYSVSHRVIRHTFSAGWHDQPTAGYGLENLVTRGNYFRSSFVD